MALDLDDDWRFYECFGLEDVDYFDRLDAALVERPVGITNALVGATQSEDLARLALDATSLTFHLWLSQMPTNTVVKDEGVLRRSDGTRWVIKERGILDLGARFRCITYQEP